MSGPIMTKDDFQNFRMEVLEEMKKLLIQHREPRMKDYLKSMEVIKLLKVSPGTLQNLRDNGILPFVKVGGNIFYDAEDIQKMMNRHKVERKYNHEGL